jgi:hypothetical protein
VSGDVLVSMRRWRRAVLAAVLAAIVFGLLVLSPAPVASGAASGSQVTVCDYDHLLAAITAANGDTVTFACSGTITVSPPITVPNGQQVSLDSTGQAIVLLGSADRIVDVEGGTLVLTGSSGGNLVLRGGSRTGSPALGGAIFIASGSTAELSYVSVEDSLVAGDAGNADQPGGAASGGAIYNDGSLTVSHSLFARNGAVAGGSSLEGVGGDASGGAIFNDGSLELGVDVTFSGDYVSGGRGGVGGHGADNEGVGGVDEDVSTERGGAGGTGGHGGSAFGGAIFNGGTLTAISQPTARSARPADRAGPAAQQVLFPTPAEHAVLPGRETTVRRAPPARKVLARSPICTRTARPPATRPRPSRRAHCRP